MTLFTNVGIVVIGIAWPMLMNTIRAMRSGPSVSGRGTVARAHTVGSLDKGVAAVGVARLDTIGGTLLLKALPQRTAASTCWHQAGGEVASC